MSDIDIANNRWLLPEGIEEILPEQAMSLERVRRELLDLYASWGYQLIITPMIEYLESLQTGTGQDLDLQTFKLIDSLTGRMMGVRADITPQAARIDAHLLNRVEPVRLCYLGTVLRAYPDSLGGSRAPLQIGAELYGHGGIESDIEIIELMLETVKRLGVGEYHLDLGHVAIYRELARQAQLSTTQETALFAALQRKAVAEINQLLKQWAVPNSLHTLISALANLNGGHETLHQAKAMFIQSGPVICNALEELERIASKIAQRRPDVAIHFDLSELRGYNYQSGVVFAVLVPGCGQEVARGGRYDEIGKIFGRSRPATGFSADLKILLEQAIAKPAAKQAPKAVFAPASDDEGLLDMIMALRSTGECVIAELPGQSGTGVDMGCDRTLTLVDGQWEIKKLKN